MLRAATLNSNHQTPAPTSQLQASPPPRSTPARTAIAAPTLASSPTPLPAVAVNAPAPPPVIVQVPPPVIVQVPAPTARPTAPPAPAPPACIHGRVVAQLSFTGNPSGGSALFTLPA